MIGLCKTDNRQMKSHGRNTDWIKKRIFAKKFLFEVK